MPEIEIAVKLLLVAMVVTLISRWRRRPYTIALVIIGLVLGLAGVLEPIQLTKQLILTIFLPPLLFEGALHIRAHVLQKRSHMVFGMALLGTFLTTYALRVYFFGRILNGGDPLQQLAL